MFYRPGGSDTRINSSYDEVYSDQVNGATGWLPVNRGDWLAVNVVRASIDFVNAASSVVKKTPQAPQVVAVLEMKTIGGQADLEAWPIDRWQDLLVATGMQIHRAGFVRLRILSINNQDGTGAAMALQVNRNGNMGVAS